MSSAAKTLELLSHFSTSQREIGLSHLCRLAKRDKATTYRYLQSLEEVGFVEQNPVTKTYRLGPAVLQLAQIRETTVPRKDGAQSALRTLSEVTSETAHVSVLSGTTLYSLTSCESPKHSIRAIIDIAVLPLHATASGLCALAFGPDSLTESALLEMQGFTPSTPQSPADLKTLVHTVRETGFGKASELYEADIIGRSAPLFDHTGLFAGAVSVASVASRTTPDLEHITKAALVTASREITHNWGGKIPASVETSWAATLANSHSLEPIS